MYLCGRLNIYDWLQPIGNIKNQTFHEIWNGSERKKQLEMEEKINHREDKEKKKNYWV